MVPAYPRTAPARRSSAPDLAAPQPVAQLPGRLMAGAALVALASGLGLPQGAAAQDTALGQEMGQEMGQDLARTAAPVPGLPFALDEILVTAAQEPQAAAQSGVSASVLAGPTLENAATLDLKDTLARLPGVGILARGPLGTQSGLTVRGIGQNYLKVYFDGIDIGDPSGPQVAYDFGRLTAPGVGRVELLRGSQSAVHGSQAVAGVLSLDSWRPETLGASGRLELEGGSYGTRAGSLSWGVQDARGGAGATLAYLRSDGFSAADEADGNTEADGYEATRLTLWAEAQLQSGAVLGFTALAENSAGDYDETAFTPSFESYPTDGTPDERSRAETRGLRAYLRFDTGPLEHELAASWYRVERSLQGSTALYGPTRNDYEGERRSLSWSAATGLGGGRLVFGADLTDEDYAEASDSAGFLDSSAGGALTRGVFAEYVFAPVEGLDLTASLRHDDHAALGGVTTGRVALAWAAAPDLTLRAALATGYRAPSGYELYGPYGDRGLQPEESTSADLGLEKRFGNTVALRGTLFWIETDSLIDYAWPAYYQVPGTTTRQGAEIELEAEVTPGLTLTAAYTHTVADNPVLSAGSAWSAGFGRHQLALGLDAEIGARAGVSVTALHVADRKALPDYTVVNVAMRYDLGADTEATLRVENLFDEQYQLWDGYGTSDRALYVGLRKSF